MTTWHLHIGMFKTGTTAFQDQMAASRHTLRRSGVVYPSTAIVRGRHAGLVLSMVDPDSVGETARRSIPRVAWQELLRQIEEDAAVNGAEKILLSAENFSSFAPETFSPLLDEMRRSGELKVVTLIRDQVSAMASMYRHVVRTYGFVRSFDAFVNDQFRKEDKGYWRGQPFDLRLYLDRWRQVVGDSLIVGVYDEDARANIGRYILGLLGLDGIALPLPPAANLGLDGPFIDAGRRLNRLLDGDARRKAMGILLEAQSLSTYERFHVPDHLCRKIRARYEVGNKELAEMFFLQGQAPSWLLRSGSSG